MYSRSRFHTACRFSRFFPNAYFHSLLLYSLYSHFPFSRLSNESSFPFSYLSILPFPPFIYIVHSYFLLHLYISDNLILMFTLLKWTFFPLFSLALSSSPSLPCNHNYPCVSRQHVSAFKIIIKSKNANGGKKQRLVNWRAISNDSSVSDRYLTFFFFSNGRIIILHLWKKGVGATSVKMFVMYSTGLWVCYHAGGRSHDESARVRVWERGCEGVCEREKGVIKWLLRVCACVHVCISVYMWMCVGGRV